MAGQLQKSHGQTAASLRRSRGGGAMFWLDWQQGNKVDHERSMLWMAPRKPKMSWSKLNKGRVEKLINAALWLRPGLLKWKLQRKTAHGTPWMLLQRWKSRLILPEHFPEIRPQRNTLNLSRVLSKGRSCNGSSARRSLKRERSESKRRLRKRRKIFVPVSGSSDASDYHLLGESDSHFLDQGNSV